MELCPNCCEELIKKKYNHRARLKCMSCGYETSEWEIDHQAEEYFENKRLLEQEQYNDNENYQEY